MDYVVIAAAALLASVLTLFSGFGLGTLLMPVIALFLPLDVAIGVTALVHFANNLFKVGLFRRQADLDILVRFGLPAILAAIVGALLLASLSTLPPLFSYDLLGQSMDVYPLKLCVGLIILCFVLLELSPRFNALSLERRFLPLGGVISGFFGGLSGHQGAFRSLFLIKAGLDKNAFIATSALLAALVDVTRLLIYGWRATFRPDTMNWSLAGIAALAAFIGAYWGKRLLGKTTRHRIQQAVSALLVVIGFGLATGVV